SIYDKNLFRNNHDINLSSLSFLFSEMISLSQSNSKGIQHLEKKLNNLGYSIGIKYLELINLRENYINNLNSNKNYVNGRREIRIIELLQFIHTKVWKSLFGKIANNLEKSSDKLNEYMITDDEPIFSKFISIPKDFGDLNCCAFVAGIIEGITDSAYLQATVTAHTVASAEFPTRTVYLINFNEDVIKREKL
ncbi:hypothetical protein PACTADRAFT_30423, partial [Pachysolen tannophilus NRRL Y-2460]